MQRIIGWILVGLGAFALVTAGMLKWYAYDKVAVVPLDHTSTTVSVGEDMTYFDQGSLSEQVDTLTSTRQVIGDVDASEDAGDNTAVWDTSVTTTNTAGVDLSVTTARIAFERTTGEGVDCCDTSYEDKPVAYQGLYFKLPFNAQKKTYQYWDDDLQATSDMVYDSTTKLEGLTTYVYVQTIEPTMVGTLQVPPSVVGEEGTEFIPADRYYGNVRTLWVEPETGVIVKGQEEQNVTLRIDGEDRAVLTRGTIAYNDDTVKDTADEFSPLATQLKIVRVYGPIFGLIGGLVLIGVGVLLVAMASRRRDPDATGGQPAQPATVDA